VIIRREQLLAFERRAVQGFVSRMENRLRTVFPEQLRGTGSDDMRRQIETAIGIAKRFALTRECDVEGYLIVMCASSADLRAEPPDWMLSILTDAGIHPEGKVGLLYRAYEDQQRGR
jgi:hypothetical protein